MGFVEDDGNAIRRKKINLKNYGQEILVRTKQEEKRDGEEVRRSARGIESQGRLRWPFKVAP